MKKVIAALLCAVMLLGTVAVSASALTGNSSYPNMYYSEAEHTLGDATGDGEINAEDDFAIKLKCAKIGSVELNNADIVADGKISAKDLLALKRHIAGLEDLSAYETDPEESAINKLTIAENDISEYCIVYAPDAEYVENMYLAADTLRKYINIATGTNLKIDTEPTAEHKIVFVDVNTIDGLAEELFIENYKWEVVNGDVFIYGTRRGSLYAVWEILEDYLGYRFYVETDTFQYTQNWVDIPEGTSSFVRPGLEFRQARQTSNNDAMLQKFPRRLNSSQAFSGYTEVRFGTLTGPHYINAHSYGEYWQMATGRYDVNYDEKGIRSEYKNKLAMGEPKSGSGWNPCFTSDEQYETLFRGLLETMRYIQDWNTFRKHTSLMSFSINDNRVVCSCTDCKFIMADGTSGRGENKVTRLAAGEAGLNLHMANRAARDIREYYEGRPASTPADGYDSNGDVAGYGEPIYDEYPDMRIYSIFYDDTPPHENLYTDPRYAEYYLIPEENLTIVWCGNPCNNHFIGANECNGQLNILGKSGESNAESLKAWGEIFKKEGATLWFWYYPVNYNTYMTDSPNIINIYYDLVYLVTECNVTGIFYEGGGVLYNFERLKEHLAVVFMWSVQFDENGELTYMSYDEWTENMKEYLMIYYGAGYEEVYEYILMHDEAGNQSGNCYINNCDYPGDMFSYDYIRDNYEEMRALLVTAMEKAERQEQKDRIEHLLVSCDFLGLSACYQSWYANGTEESKARYVELYDYMFNYVTSNKLRIGSAWNVENLEYDLTCMPIVAFYTAGTWREELNDQWKWTGSKPGWGYA